MRTRIFYALAFAVVLSVYVGARVAMAAGLAQADPVPSQLADTIDTLLRLSSLALMVIPVTEVRKLLGGLPDIPLPSSTNPDGTIKRNVIKAGRWFSTLVSAGVLFFGHAAGILNAPDWADPQAWLAVELAILAGVANIVYARWWKAQIGLYPDVVEATARAMASRRLSGTS